MTTPDTRRDRKIYRRRRLIDAARLLPVLGVALFVFPAVLLPSGTAGSTALRLIYFIGCWAVLIVGAFFIARILAKDDAE